MGMKLLEPIFGLKKRMWFVGGSVMVVVVRATEREEIFCQIDSVGQVSMSVAVHEEGAMVVSA